MSGMGLRPWLHQHKLATDVLIAASFVLLDTVATLSGASSAGSAAADGENSRRIVSARLMRRMIGARLSSRCSAQGAESGGGPSASSSSETSSRTTAPVAPLPLLAPKPGSPGAGAA